MKPCLTYSAGHALAATRTFHGLSSELKALTRKLKHAAEMGEYSIEYEMPGMRGLHADALMTELKDNFFEVSRRYKKSDSRDPVEKIDDTCVTTLCISWGRPEDYEKEK